MNGYVDFEQCFLDQARSWLLKPILSVSIVGCVLYELLKF